MEKFKQELRRTMTTTQPANHRCWKSRSCKNFPHSQGLLRRRWDTCVPSNGVSFMLHEGKTLGLVGESGYDKPAQRAVSCGPLSPPLVRCTPHTSRTEVDVTQLPER